MQYTLSTRYLVRTYPVVSAYHKVSYQQHIHIRALHQKQCGRSNVKCREMLTAWEVEISETAFFEGEGFKYSARAKLVLRTGTIYASGLTTVECRAVWT